MQHKRIIFFTHDLVLHTNSYVVINYLLPHPLIYPAFSIFFTKRLILTNLEF